MAAEAFNAISKEQSLEHVVVPVFNIAARMAYLSVLSEKCDVLIPCYGHAGDGNLHATVLKKEKDTAERWKEILPQNILSPGQIFA